MASSVSGQDEPNPAMWLATRAGKIALSCPLGITRCIPRENSVLFVNKQAKGELGQYPAILPSQLVNNPYILTLQFLKTGERSRKFLIRGNHNGKFYIVYIKISHWAVKLCIWETSSLVKVYKRSLMTVQRLVQCCNKQNNFLPCCSGDPKCITEAGYSLFCKQNEE